MITRDTNNLLHWDFIATCTLGELIRQWQHGNVSRQNMKRFLAIWNATPGRFTVAKLVGDNVMQFDKE